MIIRITRIGYDDVPVSLRERDLYDGARGAHRYVRLAWGNPGWAHRTVEKLREQFGEPDRFTIVKLTPKGGE